MSGVQKSKHEGDQRWRMLRDLGVLQVKLLIDGLRDLLLVPASLLAGLLSLISAKDGRPGPQFYQLLDFGKQSELWINLFGALRHAPQRKPQQQAFREDGVDELLGKLESYVVDEYKRGGVTAQAKQRLDKVFDSLQKNRSAQDDY